MKYNLYPYFNFFQRLRIFIESIVTLNSDHEKYSGYILSYITFTTVEIVNKNGWKICHGMNEAS